MYHFFDAEPLLNETSNNLNITLRKTIEFKTSKRFNNSKRNKS